MHDYEGTTKMKVIILCGSSGAGKSTVAQTLKEMFLKNGDPVSIFSADHHMVDEKGNYLFDRAKLPDAHNACLRAFTRVLLLREEGVLIVDNTNTTRQEVAPYAQLALAHSASLTTMVVVSDPQISAQRNIHEVPEAQVLRQHLRLMKEFPKFPHQWNVEVVYPDKSKG